ncbi:hypothetical protein ADIAL_1770 [Alkalibacterium sp. AK22]|nr:hypothetical protein ADIAL_1770 [Alkalibacterium sp. AK22]
MKLPIAIMPANTLEDKVTARLNSVGPFLNKEKDKADFVI